MGIYFLLFAIIYVLNVIPAFMPPTWIVLAFFYIHFRLDLLPTSILGTTAATLGRITLSLISKKWLVHVFPKDFVNNYRSLGNHLKSHNALTIPVVLGYAFSPVSSNVLFIISGLTDLNLKLIGVSFYLGRLFSYTFWITTSYHISRRFEEIFIGHLSRNSTIISTLISFLLIFIIGKIKWHKVLKKHITGS